MNWVNHAVSSAPEIFLFLAVAIGTILGRIRIRGFAIGATACILIVAVILGQLGNRVEHALRAYTPRDQKAIRAVAETFRTNPEIDVETAVTELQVGEALLSFLDEKGAPGVVQGA